MGARVRVISIILSFTTPFVVSEGVHTYLLLGDGSGLSLHDSMTVGLTTGETIVARGVSTGIGVVVSGTAAPVRHRVINHEPVIATSLLSPAQYGAAYLVPIVASDADDDTLSFSLTSAPAWLSIGTGPFPDVSLFRFLLRADGDTMTVSDLTLTLSFTGLTTGGVTGLVVLEDTNGDGVPDGDPVTVVGTVTETAASWTGLTLTIDADRARTFIVQAFIATIQAADRLTLGLAADGVTAQNDMHSRVTVTGATTVADHHAAGVPGDVTFDLVLDIRDVVKEVRAALGIIQIDGPSRLFDLNGDELVDIVDIVALVQRILTGNIPTRLIGSTRR